MGKPPSQTKSCANQTEEEEFKRQIKHLQEEIDNLKQDSSRKNNPLQTNQHNKNNCQKTS